MLQVDGRYLARVERPRLTESENGTPGIYVHFNCGDAGAIDHTVYITQSRLEIAERELNNMGVSSEKLRSDQFWTEVERWLEGATCEIVIGEEEYKGKMRLKVKFINAIAKPARAGTGKRLAAMFGGNQPTPGSPSQRY